MLVCWILSICIYIHLLRNLIVSLISLFVRSKPIKGCEQSMTPSCLSLAVRILCQSVRSGPWLPKHLDMRDSPYLLIVTSMTV